MAQFGRPISNITTTNFTGGYAEIDESSASDTDFAYGADNSVATLEVALTSTLSDPGSSSGHTFRYRVAKSDGGVIDGGGNSVDITAHLYQGTTLIASDTTRTTTGTWTQYELTLSGAQADAITDYTDLRLRFVTTSSGGPPNDRRGGAVSWAELEIPDASINQNLTTQLATLSRGNIAQEFDYAQSIATQLGTFDIAAVVASDPDLYLTSRLSTLSIGTLTQTITLTHSLTTQLSTLSQGNLEVNVNDSVNLTGLSSTLSQGTLTVDTAASESFNATGFALTSSQGTLVINNDEASNLTGLASTLNQGNLAQEFDFSESISGLSNTLSQGILSDSISSNESLTGLSNTASQGSLVIDTGNPNDSYNAVGMVGTFDIASNIDEEIGLNLTSFSSILAQGVFTLALISTATLTGIGCSLSQGSITVDTGSASDSAAIAGQVSTLSQGSLLVNIPNSVSITGQSLTAAQGIIDTFTSLTGQQATFDIASIIKEEIGIIISGQPLTLQRGTVTDGSSASDSSNLTGQALTLAQGTVLGGDSATQLTGLQLSFAIPTEQDFSLTEGIDGKQLTLNQGAITLPGDTNVPITGQLLTLSRGTLTFTNDFAHSITGKLLTFSQNSVFISNTENDFATIQGQQLNITLYPPTLDPVLTTQLATFSIGNVSTSISHLAVFLTGIELSFDPLHMCPVRIIEQESASTTLYIVESPDTAIYDIESQNVTPYTGEDC